MPAFVAAAAVCGESRPQQPQYARPLPGTPCALPHKPFPSMEEKDRHGLRPMPPGPEMPLLDPQRLLPYSMTQTEADAVAFVPLTELTPEQLHEAVIVLGAGFAKYEPMLRHMVPQTMPDALRSAPYTDALGTHHWEDLRPKGREWAIPHFVDGETGKVTPHISRADAIAWYCRLNLITDVNEGGALRQDTLGRSTAALCKKTGEILGVCISNVTVLDSSTDKPPPFCKGHPCIFHREAGIAVAPVIDMVDKMDQDAIPTMRKIYPDFSRALNAGEVSTMAMITKSPFQQVIESPQFPVDLMKANLDLLVKLGVKYVIAESTNPWSASVSDAAGATAGLFQPHRGVEGIVKSAVPLPGTATSTNGFISDRDAGAVFYAGRLPECL